MASIITSYGFKIYINVSIKITSWYLSSQLMSSDISTLDLQKFKIQIVSLK